MFHRHLNADFQFARVSQQNDYGAIVRGQLTGKLELIGFGGTTRADEHNELPLVYSEGLEGLPTFRQMRLPTQDWTHWTWHDTTAGAILRTMTTGAWSLAAGIFRSVRNNPPNYDDLFLDIRPDRTVSHQIDVVPPLDASSTSGEFRLAYRTTSGPRTQVWTMTMRGRALSRTFGGDSITDLGRTSIDDYTPIPQPPVQFTAGSTDRVRQYGLGVSLDELWPGRGSIGVGVQKVNYRRSIDAPGVPTTTDKSDPLLPTVRFTFSPAAKYLLYGSYTRGLEDSELAPASAANRGESPPATTTWQVDAGVRYAPVPGTQFMLGAFEVNKAYFNLNTADVYTQLGADSPPRPGGVRHDRQRARPGRGAGRRVAAGAGAEQLGRRGRGGRHPLRLGAVGAQRRP